MSLSFYVKLYSHHPQKNKNTRHQAARAESSLLLNLSNKRSHEPRTINMTINLWSMNAAAQTARVLFIVNIYFYRRSTSSDSRSSFCTARASLRISCRSEMVRIVHPRPALRLLSQGEGLVAGCRWRKNRAGKDHTRHQKAHAR